MPPSSKGDSQRTHHTKFWQYWKQLPLVACLFNKLTVLLHVKNVGTGHTVKRDIGEVTPHQAGR
jgi:hypothetical protein